MLNRTCSKKNMDIEWKRHVHVEMRKWYEYKQRAVTICRSLNKLDLRVWNRLDIMTDLIHHSPTCRIKVYKKKMWSTRIHPSWWWKWGGCLQYIISVLWCSMVERRKYCGHQTALIGPNLGQIELLLLRLPIIHTYTRHFSWKGEPFCNLTVCYWTSRPF